MHVEFYVYSIALLRFKEIKVINCIDPQKCLINYLDPVLLEQTRPGDAKHKINFILFGLILFGLTDRNNDSKCIGQNYASPTPFF